MSKGAVEASAAARKAEAKRAKYEHEAELTAQVLTWITVTQPKRGDVLVLTVPEEYFIWPGTAPEDIPDDKKQMMETCHLVLQNLIDGVRAAGIVLGGAAILGEGMTLADLPPPWEKHPDSRDPEERIVTPGKRILLPPGTKI